MIRLGLALTAVVLLAAAPCVAHVQSDQVEPAATPNADTTPRPEGYEPMFELTPAYRRRDWYSPTGTRLQRRDAAGASPTRVIDPCELSLRFGAEDCAS